MKIQVIIRHNHHEGIPKFTITADNWEQAEQEFIAGIKSIQEQNKKYIENYEDYNCINCPIIDFEIIEDNKINRGQLGFGIDEFKTLQYYIEWYIKNRYNNFSSWFNTDKCGFYKAV